MVNASEVSQDELARYYEALGPIRDLVLDESLTEVMVNGHENIYVERNGKILLTDRKFDDENHLLRVIDFIVSAVGRRIDFRTPMVDARLLDGSRVNAVISPIALDGPMLTIRKFSRDPYQAEDLVNFGTITNEVFRLVRVARELSNRQHGAVQGDRGDHRGRPHADDSKVLARIVSMGPSAVNSPIALDGPMLTIRKFSRDPYQAEDLVRDGPEVDEVFRLVRVARELSNRQHGAVQGDRGDHRVDSGTVE